jgi:multidrug efflux system membrane fusion protein
MRLAPHPPFALFAPFIGAALLWGCGQAKAVAPAEVLAQPVRVAPVARQTYSPPVHAVGISSGKEEIKLSFKNGGTVESLRVEAGAHVRKGQVLATLNQVEIRAQVRQARANLDKAERDERRVKELQQSGSTPVADVENAQTALEVARAGLDTAAYNAGVAEIVAPEDGTIVRRLVEVNESVGGGQPIYALRSSRRGFVVRVGLADREAVEVQLGAPAKITFDAYPGRTFEGQLTELATAASPRTGTYEAEIKIDAGGTELLSGLVAHVELAQAKPETVDMIPIEALVEGSGNHGQVFTLDADNRARKLPVQIAFIDGDRVAIAQGLESVHEVVTDGASYLSQGALARPLGPGAKARLAAPTPGNQ